MILQNNAEGGSQGATVTVGNSGGASGNAWDQFTGVAPTFDNTHPAHGTYAYKVIAPAVAAETAMYWNSSLGTLTTAYGRVYCYLSALPASTQYVTLCICDKSGTGPCAAVVVNDTGSVALVDSVASVAVSSVLVRAAALFRVDWRVVCNAATGVIQAQLFTSAPDGSSPDQTITATNANTRDQFTAFKVGFDGSTLTPGLTAWYDDININTNGFPGPAVTSNPVLDRPIGGFGASWMRKWERHRSGILVPAPVGSFA